MMEETRAGQSAVMAWDNAHFLSASNPTATVDQRDMESRAIAMLELPVIVKAKAIATQRFRILAGKDLPAEGWPIFDEVMNEWAFHYVLLALNSDPNYPKVLGHWFGPPHEWFGMKVPGSRGPGTAENTDNHYSVVPVDGNARFELVGQRFQPSVGDCPIQVATNLSQSMNVASLDWRDIQFEPDGKFVVSIDPSAADGRSNHLQTTVDAKYIFIRDGRMDWRQVPNGYRVRRIDSPAHPPRTSEQIAALAARFIIDDVGPMNFFRQMVCACQPNVLPPIVTSGDVGGMPSQKILLGRLKLEDDEAFVLTLRAGGAGYWIVANYNCWLMSGNFWSRCSTRNNQQSLANPDGSYTYVFSARDPGVHNWIDTLGVREPLLMIRWHLLPRIAGGEEPVTHGQLVRFDVIAHSVPVGTPSISAAERQAQLDDRYDAFKLRYAI